MSAPFTNDELQQARLNARDAEITSLRSQLEEARRKAIEECVSALDYIRVARRNRADEVEEVGQYGLGALDAADKAVELIRALLSESKT